MSKFFVQSSFIPRATKLQSTLFFRFSNNVQSSYF